MMKALQSYLRTRFEKYVPVPGYSIENGNECCIYCGKHSNSRSNRLWISICVCLSVVLIISLSMIVRGSFQSVAQGREKLLFEEIFGEG